MCLCVFAYGLLAGYAGGWNHLCQLVGKDKEQDKAGSSHGCVLTVTLGSPDTNKALAIMESGCGASVQAFEEIAKLWGSQQCSTTPDKKRYKCRRRQDYRNTIIRSSRTRGNQHRQGKR